MAGWLCPTAGIDDEASSGGVAPSRAECIALEAFPILSQTMVVSFLCHFGFSVACGNRVGNLLGEGEPKRAKRTAIATLAFIMAFVSAICLLLIGLRDNWAALFLGAPPADEDSTTSTIEVARAVSHVLPVVAAYIFLDTIGPAWAHQILFGVGRLRYPMLNNFVAFWVLGLPLGYHLAFRAGWDLTGLWAGLVSGMGALDIGLLFYLFGYLDWGKMSRVARKRALDGAAAATSSTDGGSAEMVAAREGDRVGLASADSAAERHIEM